MGNYQRAMVLHEMYFGESNVGWGKNLEDPDSDAVDWVIAVYLVAILA